MMLTLSALCLSFTPYTRYADSAPAYAACYAMPDYAMLPLRHVDSAFDMPAVLVLPPALFLLTAACRYCHFSFFMMFRY